MANNFEFSAFAIAQDIIAIDRKIQTICQTYADHDIREHYGMRFYQLSVRITDFHEDNIIVKMKHRLLLISAQNCSKTYADVKVLPDVVDLKRGVWKYWQGELVILFQYISSNPQDQASCGGCIDESVFVLPKLMPGVYGDCFTFCNGSFGDGIIRNNVWHCTEFGPQPSGGNGFGGARDGDCFINDNVWHPNGNGPVGDGHGNINGNNFNRNPSNGSGFGSGGFIRNGVW